MVTETQFKQLLLDHDWWYDRSDDHCVYIKGARERAVLVSYATTPYFEILFNHALTAVRNGASIEPFPSKAGTRDQSGPENQTTNHTSTPMKLATDIINLLFTICFAPLIEAINNLAKSGGVAAPAPAPAAETPAAAPKEKKEKKEKKKVTADDLKAALKNVTDKGQRELLKTRVLSDFGVASLNDAKEDQFEGIIILMQQAAEGKLTAPESDDDGDL